MPKVKVRVENSSVAGEANSILLDPIEFLRDFSVLKDELVSVADEHTSKVQYIPVSRALLPQVRCSGWFKNRECFLSGLHLVLCKIALKV